MNTPPSKAPYAASFIILCFLAVIAISTTYMLGKVKQSTHKVDQCAFNHTGCDRLSLRELHRVEYKKTAHQDKLDLISKFSQTD